MGDIHNWNKLAFFKFDVGRRFGVVVASWVSINEVNLC